MRLHPAHLTHEGKGGVKLRGGCLGTHAGKGGASSQPGVGCLDKGVHKTRTRPLVQQASNSKPGTSGMVRAGDGDGGSL